MSLRSIILLCAFSALLNIDIHAQKGITNQLIWASQEFSADGVSGLSSMKDGLHYTSTEDSAGLGTQIIKYSYQTGQKVAVLATSKDIFGDPKKAIEGYEFSADESRLLIQTETEAIYRWSFKANYFIYDLTTKKTIPLTDFKNGKQRLAAFSPDAKTVAFMRDNNLFTFDTNSKKEVQITSDGAVNSIINGGTDWVYEEEFGFDRGFYWSPKGNRIAYYKFDESAVREYGMDLYGDLYPERYDFKYPKAGEKNSTVSIHIYDLGNGQTSTVNIGTEKDQYIPRIKWTQNNDQLCVMRMNRHQNKLEFLITDLSAMQPFMVETRVIYNETADTYIDISDNLFFLKDGKTFLWTSERDNFNHLYQYDLNGNLVEQLTKGNWDIIDFYGIDEEKGMAYYSSSEIKATGKNIFCVDLKKGKSKRLDNLSGTNDASFSVGMKYFILTHSDANTPSSEALYNIKGEKTRDLATNAELKERLKQYEFTKKEFFTFNNSAGTSLNCWMMKPNNFDPSKKYPVLVAIYGGPGSNTVNDSWGGRNFIWYQMLCQEGYIVVSCDPRGTRFRGREFKHSTYMNLGKLETEDFIDFAKYLGNQSYIDKARIGMQGWSYGGYMTSLCMTKGADYYSTGIAVAPVTNWKYYDSIYTERFMRTPQENSGGYENNSPINFTNLLKGKYLLVHGSADDNVHFQNTMDMVSSLVKANKQFDLFVYPNKNHGIYGGNTRLHLFTQMTDFLKENL